MFVDDLLPPSPEFLDNYRSNIKTGQEFCKSLNITFVGLVRNLESSLYENINFLQSLGSSIFKHSNIVVFENDSTDSTKNILSILKRMLGDELHIFINDFGAPIFNSSMPIDQARSNERTTNLANYRNICKSYIKENLSDTKYTIVIDLDFKQISINGLFNTFGILAQNPDITAMVGNAYELKNLFHKEKKNLWNYDSWAFRHTWWNDKALEISWYDPMLWFGFWIPAPGLPTIKVNSAFGGMAVYPTDIYISTDYEGYDCEHVCFHKNLYKTPNFSLHLNPSQIILL